MSEERFKEIAERLWQILDNIDTLHDQIKPTSWEGYAAYCSGVRARLGERHRLLVSDGYKLSLPIEKDLKILSEAEIER